MRSRLLTALLAAVVSLWGCAPARAPGRSAAEARATASGPTDAELIPFARILRAEDRRIADEDLLALLNDDDERVRARAHLALGRIAPRNALERLLGGMSDPSPAVRSEVALALGLLGDEAALPTLVRAASDAEASVRSRVAFALGALAPGGASEALGVLLRDASPEVRTEACLAAWRLPDASFAVDALVEATTAGEVEVRFAATYALARLAAAPFAPASGGIRPGRLGRPDEERVRGVLADLAQSREAEIRMQVARGLASPSGPREEAVLGLLTRDPVPGVRINAVRSFGYRGARIDPYLRKTLNDPDVAVVRAAIESLGSIGSPDAAQILVKGILKSKDRDTWLLEPAYVALSQVSPGTARELVGELIVSTNSDLRAVVAPMLARGGDSAAIALAANLLGDAVPRVRASVVPVVALSPGRLSEILAPVLEDPDPAVRAAVAETAGKRLTKPHLPDFEREEIVSLLGRLWDLSESDEISDARLAILAAASEVADAPQAQALLEAGLRSPDRAARVRAAAILETRTGVDRSGEIGPAAERPIEDYVEILRWAGRSWAAIVVVQREGYAPGRFTMRLDSAGAPLAAWNFAKLAEKKYFDGLVVHRVVPNFVVQDGDPRGDGNGGPGWTIRDELRAERFWAGSVGMASSGPDTAGSQWFVTLSAQPHLEGRYTLFGRVAQNLEGVAGLVLPGDTIVGVRVYEGDGLEPLPPL